MNKRFTNKKPYSQTGMAERAKRAQWYRDVLKTIKNAVEGGRI
jgi:hypothetical protein